MSPLHTQEIAGNADQSIECDKIMDTLGKTRPLPRQRDSGPSSPGALTGDRPRAGLRPGSGPWPAVAP